MAERSLEAMKDRVKSRTAFGKLLAERDTIIASIAQSRMEIEQARYCTCVSICLSVCIFVCMCVCMHIYVYAKTLVRVCVYVCITFVCTYVVGIVQ